MTTKVLTAHVPLPLANKVAKLAETLERTQGWIVKEALSAWVDQEVKRRKLLLEAIAEADAGHVVDHEAVLAWAKSLDTHKPKKTPYYEARLDK